MRLVLLGPASSVHLSKIANEMLRRGHEVHVLSLHPDNGLLAPGVVYHRLPVAPPLGYYLNAPLVRQLLYTLRLDVLNAHYASGYGTLGRLAAFRPYLLSVWGSDVFDFPEKSSWTRGVLIKNLLAADRIGSTSHVMRSRVVDLCNGRAEVSVTPFGVDCTRFRPQPRAPSGRLRIGTVKRLSRVYGIDVLIDAFARALALGLPDAELVLVGDGPDEPKLRRRVKERNLESRVLFVGRVTHGKVPEWLNTFDIFAALSRRESFGVAVLEAQASGIPVVVSNAGGLPEIVVDGETGYVVPVGDVEAAAHRLVCLASDPALRARMGEKAREFVLRHFELSETMSRLEALYVELSDLSGRNM